MKTLYYTHWTCARQETYTNFGKIAISNSLQENVIRLKVFLNYSTTNCQNIPTYKKREENSTFQFSFKLTELAS